MQQIIDDYFRAWRTKDGKLLASLFTADGVYRVKPFGLEEYHGREAMYGYWQEAPVKQQDPKPLCLAV